MKGVFPWRFEGVRGEGRVASMIGLAAGALVACDVGTRPEPTPPAITLQTMKQYVTTEAAANLDAYGRWVLADPTGQGVPRLTRQEAEAIAEAWPRQFGPWLRQRLESEHGGTIDLGTVIRCGPTYYAESPYDPLDPAIATKAETKPAQRAFGPWWLVTLCSKTGRPQLSVAVAAYATELHMQGDQIVMPQVGGGCFSVEGIPRSSGQDFLESPERAVQRLALASGLRVADVPELVVPDRADGFPNHARWRLKLEAPAPAMARNGRLVRADEYYSWRQPGAQTLSFLIAASSQPSGLSFRYPLDASTSKADEPLKYADGYFARQPGVPTAFDPVTFGEVN